MATIRPLPKSAFVVHLPETDFNRARLAGYLRRCTYRSRIGNEKSLIEQLSGLGHFPGRELYKTPAIRTSGSKCRSFSAIPYPRPRTDFVRNPGFLAVRAAQKRELSVANGERLCAGRTLQRFRKWCRGESIKSRRRDPKNRRLPPSSVTAQYFLKRSRDPAGAGATAGPAVRSRRSQWTQRRT